MYNQLKELVQGKKVLILGFGREGKSTYNRINQYECEIGIADKNDITFDCNVNFHIGEDYQKAIYDYDIVFKSPGIVLEDKSSDVLKKITSQTDQMIKRYKDNIIGITGTKGKSTVTTLIYHILKNTVGNCVLMGNIGIPAFDMLEEINNDSILVYELSCHQLEYAPYSPHIAILLNVFEEHLDHYGSFDLYYKAKTNIYNNQNQTDIFICNIDNLPNKKYNINNLITVSINNNNADMYLKDDCICDFNNNIPFSELKSELLGRHNMYNIGIVYNVCKKFNISFDEFKKHLKTYKPLPHRLEFVGEYNGVKYYDDSISTISETTIRALNSISNVGTILIGGMDRGVNYSPLIEFLCEYKIDNIIFMYDTGKRIFNEINNKYSSKFNNKKLIVVNDLENAVKKAKEITKQGQACIMSPAAASYGFFKNFEERGDKFKEYIKQ